MTVKEIKQAVEQGKAVYWVNMSYTIVQNAVTSELFIKHSAGRMIALTDNEGNLNGDESEFFTK